MKVRKLVKKLYYAIIEKRRKKEKDLQRAILKKSLKGKKTQVVQ